MRSSPFGLLLLVCLAVSLFAGPTWATDCHLTGAFYAAPALVAPVIAPAALVAPAVAQVQVQTQALAVTQPVVSTLAVTGGYSSHALAVAVPVVRQRVFAVRGIHGGLSGGRLIGRRPAIVVRGRGLGIRSAAPAVIIRSRR